MKPSRKSTDKDTLICLADAKTGLEMDRLEIMHFPDRVRPCICCGKGNSSTVLGYLNNEASAEVFIDLLKKIAQANYLGNSDLLTKVDNDPLATNS